MNNLKIYIFGMLMTLVSVSAFATSSVVWTFDLPSTSTNSQNPPYPVVATLTLTQDGTGVDFLLTPNPSSPGVANPSTSFIDQIDYVYSGRALTSTDYSNIIASSSGAPVQSVKYQTNKNNMDSSYTTLDQHVVINFVPKHGSSEFSFADTSSWIIEGASLSDFADTYATSNSHPSPIEGVISVAPYTLGGTDVCGPSGTGICTATSSNWVNGVASAVPEPSTYAMLLAGLALIGFTVRSRKDFSV